MQVDSPARIRTVALAGHNDAGKTTLASALLYTAGATPRQGRVEDRTATTDFDPEEQERGISIGLATCRLGWRDHLVQLVDCPGYGIFFSETKAGLRVSDSLLMCVNAVAGVEVNTEKTWEYAEEIGLPVVFHLAKMDRERADFERALESVQKTFGRQALPVQLPIGEEKGFRGVIDLVAGKAWTFEPGGNGKGVAGPIPSELAATAEAWRTRLIEAVAESDESLLERFFEEGTLTGEELTRGLRTAIATRRLFPVTLGAPGLNVGSSVLLDFFVDQLPSPAERGFPAHLADGSEVRLGADPSAPLVALAFKTLNDPFTGRLTLVRLLDGTLSNDAQVVNVRAEESEKAHAIAHVQGRQGSATPKLIAGEIGAIPKLKETLTGDTLVSKERVLRAAWIHVAEPAMSFAIEPKSKGDEEKIGDSLARLIEEDPSLRAGRDPQTAEFLLSGTGQLHVEIALARLKRRSNVEVILHPPKVPYRETILRPADGHGRHKKQTGGRGQFADCRIKIEPLPRGAEFEFVDEIFGGAIPQNYRPAVEKGIQDARARGYLAGFPVVDFRVRLLDGQYHDVDSSELAFKIAGSLAFKEAMEKATPTILEPIMKVEVHTSEEFMGDIMSDLSHRRGRPQGMDSKSGIQIVHASVPMAEMLNYAPALRSMTQGRSSFHMEYSHYEEVPRPVQEKLIAQARKHHKEEQEA
ncbi:MAG: elongation factor G [Thermoanaerobaculia bacterium]|nr:MAG: elongation factor G [Thermoanaerobaculia bacterium]